MNKIGFNAAALGGGGGCGAYQIGVMKAMSENGTLKDIECFSGTSVGALNAILFSLGDTELAEYVWTKWVDPVGMLGNIRLGSNGFHPSRDTLVAILKNVGVTRIRSTAPVYACAYNVTLKRAEYFYLNESSENEIIEILLASSAMSVIYERVKLGEYTYIDGGSLTAPPLANYPAEILSKKGYRDILLIPLRHDFDGHHVYSLDLKSPTDIYRAFPDANIGVIKPCCNIGSIIDFDPGRIKMRMALGYSDTKTFFGNNHRTEGHVHVIRSLAKQNLINENDMENFIALRKHKYITADRRTHGGHVFYRDIFKLNGYRIQWHSEVNVPVAGKLFELHYRILNGNDELQAYYFDPGEFIYDLMLFSEQKKSGKIKNIRK